MTGSGPTIPAFDAQRALHEIDRFQAVIDSWDDTQRATVAAYKQSIEALHAETFRRLIRALKPSDAAMDLLKKATTDELVYAVLRHHNIIKPSMQEQVEAALQSVRPMLAAHGGDVELVRVVPPDTVEVRFIGACDSCPASALTFHAGVKKAVQDRCPEITEIVQVKGLASHSGNEVRFVSPFSLPEGGEWHPVCSLDEIPRDDALFAKIGGQPVILAHIAGGGVACFQNACAHMGWPLTGGAIKNGVLECPSHGFRYDLNSGECLTATELRLQAHAVRVTGDRVEIRLIG